jgi:CubicO group peptidase (beta-lactamase class C family)
MPSAHGPLTLTPAALNSMDDVVRRVMANDHLPGVVYGVVANGELAHVTGLGSVSAPDVEARTPDQTTVFRIASMTKSFTAAAILLLRDEGRLRFDEPVATYVPAVADFRLPTSDSPAITVRHLLSMASGLATDDAWGDRHLHETAAWMDELLGAGGTFAVTPGTAFEYSNYGFAILGRVIDNVTGATYQRLISERLLAPLGMAATTWVAPSAPAVGCRWIDDHWVAEEPLGDGAFAAMGGLWSNVEDLTRWVAFFLDAWPPRDDVDDGPLRRSSRREMQQVVRGIPVSVTILDKGKTRLGPSGYGMGLNVIHDLTLGHMVAHSGGLPGFGSNMRWSIARNVGMVALGNVTYAPMTSLTRELFDVLEDSGVLPLPVPLSSEVLSIAANKLTDLLFEWDDNAADELFADNVFLDNERHRRRDEAKRFSEACGAVLLRTVGVDAATNGTMVLQCERGAARVELQLSAEVPPLVQWYELTFPAAVA